MEGKEKPEGPELKATVAWAALSGAKSMSELASEYGINPITITRWKQELLAEVAELFNSGKKSARA